MMRTRKRVVYDPANGKLPPLRLDKRPCFVWTEGIGGNWLLTSPRGRRVYAHVWSNGVYGLWGKDRCEVEHGRAADVAAAKAAAFDEAKERGWVR